MSEKIKIKTCPFCFGVWPENKLKCGHCGHSFAEDRPSNPINKLARTIISEFNLNGSHDLFILTQILSKHIIGLNSVSIINKKSMLKAPDGYMKNEREYLLRVRMKNILEEMKKYNCINESVECFRDEEEAISSIYIMRGM